MKIEIKNRLVFDPKKIYIIKIENKEIKNTFWYYKLTRFKNKYFLSSMDDTYEGFKNFKDPITLLGFYIMGDGNEIHKFNSDKEFAEWFHHEL